MAPEVKYLGDGSVVLVVGEGDPRQTSLDGGRTLHQVDSVLVARLTTEEVEADAVLDERPTFNADTQTWEQVQKGSGGASLAEPGTTAPGSSALGADVPAEPWTPAAPSGSGVAEGVVTHSRGEAQNADQLQAEIDRLTAERDALAADEAAENAVQSNPPSGATPPGV